MKNCINILLLLSFSIFSKAQDRQTIQSDSLLAIISHTENDSIKANYYAQLGAIWQAKNFQKTIEYAQQALKYAQKYGNQAQEVGLMFGLGYAYMNIGNAAASLDIMQQVLPLVKNKNLDQYGTALNFISMNYTKQQDYENALKYMRAALALEPQMIRENTPMSQQSYLACYMELSNIFSSSNQIDSALYYGEIAYKRLLSEKLQPQSMFFAWNIPRIYGDAQRKAKHNDRAMKLYREALINAENQNFQTAVHSVKLSLAHLFHQTKQLDSSLTYAREALIGFEQSGDYPQLSDAGMLLYVLYKLKNNPEKALYYYEIGMAAKDSVLNRDKIVQVQYLTYKEERQKRELDIENEKNQTRQRLYVLLAGLASFVLIALILYGNNRQKQRLNEQLSLQKKEIENLNEGLEQKVEQRTAELLQALEEVQTAFAKGQTVERKRVSADLHDEIGAALSTIAIFSDITKRKAQKTAPELVGELDRIGTKSREMVQTMRDTIWSLNEDSQQSVWERMNLIATEVLTAKGIALEWHQPLETDLPELSFNTKRHLFLVFKEAINNIVKHAEARQVIVDLKVIEGACHLFLSDNGKGFDLQNVNNRSNGLKNFEKRMVEIGGTMTIESAIGKGTRLIFVLPIA